MLPEQRDIKTGGGDFREIRNSGIYVEGNLFLTLEQISSLNRSKTEKLLLRQIRSEVFSRIKQSLHNQIFITIEKEEQDNQIKRPWDYEVTVGTQKNKKLDANVTIQEVFERSDIQGRLLILGRPGSGKTTTLLDLAKSLLLKVEDPEEPIPVIINLSTWASKQESILDWLAEEIKVKYGLRPDIGKKWLQEQKLLPLLDGLDEVKSTHQRACVEAINCWITSSDTGALSNRVVVCSRIEEYEQINLSLNLNGAIRLTELTEEQIKDYLEKLDKKHLWSQIKQNHELNDLIRAPLFLSMLVVTDQAYPNMFQSFQKTSNAQFILINLYTEEMLSRIEFYTAQKVRSWLIWLAQNLEKDEQTEFLIEKIQPNLLQSEKSYEQYLRRVRRIIALVYGLMSGLSGGLIIAPVYGLMSGLLGGLIVGLTVVVIYESGARTDTDWLGGGPDEIRLNEYITSAWTQTAGQVLSGITYGLFAGVVLGVIGGAVGGICGLIVGLIYGLVGWGSSDFVDSLIGVLRLGLMVGTVSGLMVGLIGGLSENLSDKLIGSEIEQRTFVNQGIWKSLESSLALALSGGLIGGLLGGLTCELIGGLNSGLIGGAVAGLTVGLSCGLLGGLGDCFETPRLTLDTIR